MIDSRIATITDLLKKHRDSAAQLVELLAPEIMSYETVRADHDRKRLELQKLEDEKKLEVMQIEKAKETAGSIINMAKEEAKKIELLAKDNVLIRVTEANKLLDTVKQFVVDVEKKRYTKLRDEADKLATA